MARLAFWRGAGIAAVAAPPPPLAADEGDTIRQIRELARDLITLEINTIIKENMVAGPMPTVPNALIEIAGSYLRAFGRLKLDVRDVYAVPVDADEDVWAAATVHHRDQDPSPGFFQLADQEIAFVHLFLFLRWAARNAKRAHRARYGEKDLVTLQRIEDNSDKIRSVLVAGGKRYTPVGGSTHFAQRRVTLSEISTRTDLFIPPPDLTVHERLLIKKVWEVGCEWVVAQTVIQIDGDVVTRIARDFGKEPDIDKLLALHQQGLDTGLARWDSLVNAAVAVVRGLTGNLLRG